MSIILEFRGDYAFLSNYYPCRVEYEGDVYTSVENAYQASKFPKELREPFFHCRPGVAKKMSRTTDIPIRKEFKRDKVKIMKELVLQKFSNSYKLKRKLLDTKDSILVEGTTWGDTFWGVDLKKPCKECEFGYEGENMLGKILMEVREILRNEK